MLFNAGLHGRWCFSAEQQWLPALAFVNRLSTTSWGESFCMSTFFSSSRSSFFVILILTCSLLPCEEVEPYGVAAASPSSKACRSSSSLPVANSDSQSSPPHTVDADSCVQQFPIVAALLVPWNFWFVLFKVYEVLKHMNKVFVLHVCLLYIFQRWRSSLLFLEVNIWEGAISRTTRVGDYLAHVRCYLVLLTKSCDTTSRTQEIVLIWWHEPHVILEKLRLD